MIGFRATSSLFVSLALASSSATASAETLRVLTYNIWGIPIITPARAERVLAIGEAIEALAPDVVALQEVWLDRDARALSKALAKAGLVHTRRFESQWPGHSGLLIGSRYPIRSVSFAAYSQGAWPHTLWHLDWIAGKGAARLVIESPVGDIDFAATHLQARYGSDEYLPVQVSQMLEASDLVGGPPGIGASALIVAGDLNADWSALPFRVLAARAGLTLTDERCGIDSVLYRSGGGIDIRTKHVRKVFDEPRPVGGENIRLSDHAGVLAELEVTRAEKPMVSLAFAAERWHRVVSETKPIIQARLLLAQANLSQNRTVGFLLIAASLLMWPLRRRWTRQRLRHAVSALALVGALNAGWYLYLGLAYGPTEVQGLVALNAQLTADD